MDDVRRLLTSFADYSRDEALAQLEVQLSTLNHWRAGTAADVAALKEQAERIVETNQRLALLVRLLIAKGVFSAEEYAGLISNVRTQAPDATAKSEPPVT